MGDARDMLAILGVILETSLETVKGGDAEKVHFRLWTFSYSI
jgi:hypothetical protein